MDTQINNIEFCIVIPCYNEARKFKMQAYVQFLEQYSKTILCIVNDGSTDDTLKVLIALRQKFPKQVALLSYKKNKGKAEAVRTGILYSNKTFCHKHIAYLDADLAVSLEECHHLKHYLDGKITFCFGSRILKLGSTIKRKRFRFLIGRIVATLISEALTLKVYDTQCGCKLFTRQLSSKLFTPAFISKWLFDVELFFRMLKLYGKEKALTKMSEIPLVKWIDPGDSKVKFTYAFILLFDLYKIWSKYTQQRSVVPLNDDMILE